MDFKLYKNNNLKIFKNNIAYFKKHDKILFVADNEHFSISIKNNYLDLEKENDDSIFKLSLNNSSIKLKKHNITFNILIEDISIKINGNKYIINYKLESDEELTTIEIITYNELD
ncbi:MAG: hypothetical protein IJ572_04870 [Bacilli bacterium]|nr:hypothetical protein [Bacilli bacterium]